MSTSTANRKNGIQWTPWKHLEDLDFADDVALLSHTQHQMQEKTTKNIISQNSARIGLDIHPTKSQILKVNTENTTPIVLGDIALEEVDSFTYLGSNVDKQGGTDADIRIRIGKARAAFHQLRSVWRSTILSTKTRLRIFNSIVKPVLLYGAETWRTTVANTKKLQTFLNTCLRKILKSHWPDIISNQELWRRTNQQPIPISGVFAHAIVKKLICIMYIYLHVFLPFFFFFFFFFFSSFFWSLQSSVNIVICHVTFVPYHYILPVKIVLCFDSLI